MRGKVTDGRASLAEHPESVRSAEVPAARCGRGAALWTKEAAAKMQAGRRLMREQVVRSIGLRAEPNECSLGTRAVEDPGQAQHRRAIVGVDAPTVPRRQLDPNKLPSRRQAVASDSGHKQTQPFSNGARSRIYHATDATPLEQQYLPNRLQSSGFMKSDPRVPSDIACLHRGERAQAHNVAIAIVTNHRVLFAL